MSLQASRQKAKLVIPTLSSLRVRPNKGSPPKLPDQLHEGVVSHYRELSRTKMDKITAAMPNKGTHTIYSKPVIPNSDQMKSYLKSNQIHEFLEEAHEKRSTETKRPSLKQVDFLMYRSLPALHAISTRMFSELKAVDPHFKPYSLLDMGHNLGSAVWAVQEYYGESLGEYVIHEHTREEYQRTVELLNNKYKPHIENVRVKGGLSLPRAHCNRFDVITAVNYFPFLQDYQLAKWLEKLLGMADSYIIIADISNRFTASRMAKLRTLLLKKHRHQAHIIGPCPHAMRCPQLLRNDANGCRFGMKNILPVNLSHLMPKDHEFMGHQSIDYSYLILKVGQNQLPAPRQSARLLTRKDNAHGLQFLTCNEDGTLWDARIKDSTSPRLHRHLQSKRSGDLVSAEWKEHPFQSMRIAWENRVVGARIQQRKDKNRKKFGRQERMIDTIAQDILGEGEAQDMPVEEQSRGFEEEEAGFGEDRGFEQELLGVLESDHIESIGSLNEFDETRTG